MSNSRTVHRLFSAAIIATSALVAAGCDVLVQTLDHGHMGGAQATRTWTKTYPVSASGVEVVVANVNGRIEVQGSEGRTVEVKAELTARAGSEQAAKELLAQVEIKDEASPTRVRIETRNKKTFLRQGVQVVYSIRVPKTAKVNVETANGAISVSGIEGGTRAMSSNGSVEGRQLAGAVRASTTNGSIKVELTEVGTEGTELETTNGSIEVRLFDTVRANLLARCMNGGISVDGLSFERTGESNRRKLDGRVNGGGPTLRAETVNGGIRFRKVS